MSTATAPEPSGDAEARLLGRLALSPGEHASAVLIAQLSTREVLFFRNVDEPEKTAETAFHLYSSARQLGTDLPMHLRIEGPTGGLMRYKAIYTDGSYLLYADIEQQK